MRCLLATVLTDHLCQFVPESYGLVTVKNGSTERPNGSTLAAQSTFASTTGAALSSAHGYIQTTCGGKESSR